MTTMRNKQVLPTRSGFPSRRRARWEAYEARSRGLALPAGHPYEFLPRKTPYWLAMLITRLVLVVRHGKSHPA
ncbi:hypothetical protein [Caulobacter sp.]|uniref:hypothetical protein n=1 Tax=Caulobacter sp. TaxID=78 RepID=UPI003BAA9FC0